MHLWGKRREEMRLASPVGLRFARMGNTRAMQVIALTVTGYWLGGLGYFVTVFGVAGSSFVGKVPGATLIEEVRKLLSQGLWKFGVFAAVLGSLYFTLPLLGRWGFSWRAPSIPARDRAAERRTKRRGRRILVAFIVLWALAVATMFFVSAWQPACMIAGKVAFGAGLSMTLTGLFVRHGAHVVCATCSYPMGSWRGAGERCPECGNAWKEPWRSRLGGCGVSWALVGWGSACVLLGAALAVLIGRSLMIP
jgi:hypothetical protein